MTAGDLTPGMLPPYPMPPGLIEYACQIRPPDEPGDMCMQPAWRMAGRCSAGHQTEVSLCASHRGLMGMASCIAVAPGVPECGRPVTFRVISKSPRFVPPSDEGAEHELGGLVITEKPDLRGGNPGLAEWEPGGSPFIPDPGGPLA